MLKLDESSYVQQIDESPLDGNIFDRESLEQLAKEGVTLVGFLMSRHFICHGMFGNTYFWWRKLSVKHKTL